MRSRRLGIVIASFGIFGLGVVALAGHLQPAGTSQKQPASIVNRLRPASRVTSMPHVSLTPGIPQRIVIPKLAVDTHIKPVGLTADSEMVEPADAQSTTWYKYGYLPGALGNAVIAGHYLFHSQPAIFHELSGLVVGDDIQIINDQAHVLFFTVSATEHVATESAPDSQIFGKSPTAQLKLVTCYGRWNKASQRYEERYIVTAQFKHESPQ